MERHERMAVAAYFDEELIVDDALHDDDLPVFKTSGGAGADELRRQFFRQA